MNGHGMGRRRARRVEIKRERLLGRALRKCVVCGTPLRKPKRGPTPKFCSEKCRKIARRGRRMMETARLGEASASTVRELRGQAGKHHDKAGRLNRDMDSYDMGRFKEDLRICLMRQTVAILDGDPDLIGRNGADGYVMGMLNEIDRLGKPGDAERLLRHNGYDGPMPQARKGKRK